MNTALPAAGGPATDGIQTSSTTVVVPVPTATTQTYRIYGTLVGGTGTVTGYGVLTAITAPSQR